LSWLCDTAKRKRPRCWADGTIL